MENGGNTKDKYISSSVIRQVCSVRYLLCIISAFALSFFTPYLIEMIEQTMVLMPDGISDGFRVGENYCIGVVSIPTLDLSELAVSDILIKGILSGTFAQIFVSTMASTVIVSDYECGYLKYALMRGAPRGNLLFYLISVNCIILFPIFAAFVLGLLFSLLFSGKLIIGNPVEVLTVLLIQCFMLCVVSVCSSVISVIVGNKSSTVICILGTATLPTIPRYLYALSGGQVNISDFLVSSLLINTSNMVSEEMYMYLLVSTVTGVGFYLFGLFYFKNCNFN